MIYIEKNKRNIIGLTLSETSKVSNPFYLFVFKSNGLKTDEEIIFIAPDLSAYPERLNIFELTEGENGSATFGNAHEVLSEGGAHLNLMRGQYTYTVYESLELVQTVGETTGLIVETGLMIVQATEDEADKGQNNNERNIYS